MIWIYIVTWFVCTICGEDKHTYRMNQYGTQDWVLVKADTNKTKHSKYFYKKDAKAMFDFIRHAPKGQDDIGRWVQEFNFDSLKIDSADVKWVMKAEKDNLK